MRQARRDHLGDASLMRRVGETVQEADGDRLDRLRLDLAEDAGDIRLVERRDDCPLRVHPLGDAPAPAARHQRRRQVDVDVILLEAVLVADLDGVAKPLGGDQRGPCALALDQSVGRQGRAVDDDADIGGGELRRLQHDGDRLDDAALGRARGGQHLGAEATPPELERDIREGAANIDAETRFAVRLHGVSCHLGVVSTKLSRVVRR